MNNPDSSDDEAQPVPKGKRILAVDDEPNILRFIKENLQRRSYEVETAANGVEALAKIRVDKPDALITDVMMPEMDGFELLAYVRREPSLMDLPVLMMVAQVASIPAGEDYDAFSMKEFPPECGCDFIVKPFNPDRLATILSGMFSVKLPVLQGKRILVVDDVPDIIQIIKTNLDSYGCKVETAENGAQALSRIKVDPPDLLITDKNMPEMNGSELIDAIRSDTMLEDLPILLMVSPVEDRASPNADSFLNTEANQVITKPFSPNELLAMIRSIFLNSPGKTNNDTGAKPGGQS